MSTFALLDTNSNHDNRSSMIVSGTSLDYSINKLQYDKSHPALAENSRMIKMMSLAETKAVGSRKELCTSSAHRAPQVELDWSKLGLIGRRKALHVLQKAIFDDHQSALFIQGEAGVGKTAFVQHFLKRSSNHLWQSKHHHQHHHAQLHVMCGTGKFDQYAMECLPFDPVLQALSQIIRGILKLELDQRHAVQARINVQINASQQRAIQTLLPDFVHLRDPQTENDAGGNNPNDATFTPNRSTTSTTSRTNRPEEDFWTHYSLSQTIVTLRALIHALTSDSFAKMIIFLDDLHWASPEAIDLIREVFHNPIPGYDDRPGGSSSNLTLLVTYRNETDRVHQLRECFADTATTVMSLPALDVAQTSDMVTKILQFTSTDDTQDLALAIHQKTHGNPEFCRRFMDHLVRTQFLQYSFNKFCWEWHIDKIQCDTDVTENVVQVLKHQLNQFGQQGLAVLQLAACLGFYFDVSILKEIVLREEILARKKRDLSKSMANVVMEVMTKEKSLKMSGQSEQTGFNRQTTIAAFMRESLMLRSRYQDLTRDVAKTRTAETLMFSSLIERIREGGFIERSNAWQYKFSHNQVQQACYELVPPGPAREMRHLRIGRLIRDAYAAKLDQDNCWDSEEELFANTTMLFLALEHLNKASHHIKDDEERIGLVELNLGASYTAEKNSNFHSAAKFLEHARKLLRTSVSPCFETLMARKALPKSLRYRNENESQSLSFRRIKITDDEEIQDDWKLHRQLTLEVYNASAEIERACGHFDKALDMATAVASRADGLDKLRAIRVIVDCLGVQSQLTEAIREARSALAMVNEALPAKFGSIRIWKEISALKRLLKQFSKEGLVSLPEMRVPEKREAVKLLSSIYRFAWETENESLFVGTCLRMMRITLKHGQCNSTPFVFATFAMLLSSYGDVVLGRTFLDLSQELLARQGDCSIMTARTQFASYTFANHFTQPLLCSLEPCLEAHRIGLLTGEVEYGSLALSSYACLYVMHGLSLTNFLVDMQFCSRQLTYFGQEVALSMLRPCHQFAISLSEGSLQSELTRKLTFEEMDDSTNCDDAKSVARESVLLTLRLILHYIFDELDGAFEAYTSLQKIGQGVATRTHFLYPFRLLYSSLLMFRLSRTHNSGSGWAGGSRSRYFQRIGLFHKRKIEKLVRQGAMNAKPILCLLEAEAEVTAASFDAKGSWRMRRNSAKHGINNKINKNIEVVERIRQKFDKAVVSAARSGVTHFQALANERAGMYSIEKSNYHCTTDPAKPIDEWARHYISSAVTLYAEWGAFGKVDQLRKKHSTLLEKQDYGQLRRDSLTVGAGAKARSRFGSFDMVTGGAVGIGGDAGTLETRPTYLSVASLSESGRSCGSLFSLVEEYGAIES